MNKLLALVLILGLNTARSDDFIALRSLRLNLWYQGLESSFGTESGPINLDKLEKTPTINTELIELAHKFGNIPKSSSK